LLHTNFTVEYFNVVGWVAERDPACQSPAQTKFYSSLVGVLA